MAIRGRLSAISRLDELLALSSVPMAVSGKGRPKTKPWICVTCGSEETNSKSSIVSTPYTTMRRSSEATRCTKPRRSDWRRLSAMMPVRKDRSIFTFPIGRRAM